MDATNKIYEVDWDYSGYISQPDPNMYDTQKKWEYTLAEEMHDVLDVLHDEKLLSDSGATRPEILMEINVALKPFILDLNYRHPETDKMVHRFGINLDNNLETNKIYICDGDNYGVINLINI